MKSYPSYSVSVLFLFSLTATALGADNFPLASCHGWEGTLIEKTGVNSKKASMLGVVTEADIEEYCERSLGGRTPPADKGSVVQCLATTRTTVAKETLNAEANCTTGSLTFRDGNLLPKMVSFPIPPNADVSCASGMPPLIEQFKILCPTMARRIGLE
jgi:hypothetical protein